MSEIIPPRAYTNEPDIPLALWKHEKDERGVAQNLQIPSFDLEMKQSNWNE